MAQKNYPILIAVIGGIFAILAALIPYIINKLDSSNELPEFTIDEFIMKPNPPIQGKSVTVTATIRNSGKGSAKNVLVQWWPGVNFPNPISKNISNIDANSTKYVVFKYNGYVSWYGRLETKIVVNPASAIPEVNGNNNVIKRNISVLKKR